MSTKFYVIAVWTLLSFVVKVNAQDKVECWDRFELSFKQVTKGNPFDTRLSATFVCGKEKKTVEGFYDGENTYRIRFMPAVAGEWRYVTSSSIGAMNGRKGTFTVIPAGKDNHGMVLVDGEHNFKYADGTRYYPMGTTAYAWTHMKETTQEATLKSFGEAGFNKVRMCVFPKNYSLVKDEPALYPFEIRKTIKDKEGNERKEWDFDRFDPAFFQHLEKRIDQLNRLGIEADLILFHPYDKGRWGFDAMSNEVGSTAALLKYAVGHPEKEYIVATESGILHEMQKKCPQTKFIPAPPNDSTCACNECNFMRLNTLEKLYDCLKNESPEIKVDAEIAEKAVKPIKKMLEISAKLGL